MIKNTVGTLAMARTSDINSATSQFFINLTNNSFLNNNNGRHGYSVFGKVTKGMDVIFKIANTKTKIKNGMRDVPAVPVIIKSIKSIKVKK
jgi:peptidyl-prolyl cis-trans isomerase A (cyclophilin A)